MKTTQSEWARCKPWIEAALEHSLGLESIDDVERAIADGSYVLWAGPNSCEVTEIVEFPQGKVLYLRHTAGPGALHELTESLEPMLCAFARAHGCKFIIGDGRKGWARVGKRHGYELAHITMVKKL